MSTFCSDDPWGRSVSFTGSDKVNKSLTHRPDLWGHLGMAREVSAILGLTLSDPVKLTLLPQGSSELKVDIEDLTLCPRYSALVIENTEGAASPLWLEAR